MFRLAPADDRDGLSARPRARAEGDEQRPLALIDRDARLEIQLVFLVPAGAVELAFTPFARWQSDRARTTRVGVDDGDGVGVVLDERDARAGSRDARGGAHMRATIERGIGAVGVQERRVRNDDR